MTLKRALFFIGPLLLMAIVLIMAAGTLSGGEREETPGVADGLAGKDTTDMPALAVRVGMTLSVIIILIVGGVYIIRLASGRSNLQTRSRMKVLDRCFLAPKRTLYTVRLGERIVVVGVTDTNITPVTEFSPDEGEALFPLRSEVKSEAAPFSDTLRSFVGRLAHRDA